MKNIYKSFLLFVWVALVSVSAGGQAPGLSWINSISEATFTTYTKYCNSVAVDNSGNTYIAGYFKGTFDFDPGVGVVNLTANGTFADVFLAKYDASGNYQWAKHITAYQSAQIYTGTDVHVAVNSSGGVFLTGIYEGTQDMNPGAGVDSLTALYGFSLFISKYDASGSYQWSKSIDAVYISDNLCLDNAGNIYLSGHCTGLNDFNPGPGVDSLPSAGYGGIYFAKYDPSGNFIWVKSIPSFSTSASATSIAADAAGGVYITGVFEDAALDFDPGAGVQTRYRISNGTGSDFFVAKYNSSGDFVWANTYGHPYGLNSSNRAERITIDKNNDVIICGVMSGNVDFNADTPVDTLGYESHNALGTALFFAKYNSATGNYILAKALIGGAATYASGLATDTAGNIYVAAYFEGWLDGDPGAGVDSLQSASYTAILLAKYTTAGNYLWGASIHNDNPASDGYALNIFVDQNAALYVSGYYDGTLDFDITSGISNQTAPGAVSMFVAKYGGSQTTAVGKIFTDNESMVWPNPCSSLLAVSNASNSLLEVFDVAGRKIDSEKLTAPTVLIETAAWSAGAYFVHLKSDARQQTIKVIKQ